MARGSPPVAAFACLLLGATCVLGQPRVSIHSLARPTPLRTASWTPSTDSNVIAYLLRVAVAPYCTPDTYYWITSNSVQFLPLPGQTSWLVVQSFTACSQSAFCSTNYIPYPPINTNTNTVIIVSGAVEQSPDLSSWGPLFQDPLVLTNPAAPTGYYRGFTPPSITSSNY